MPYEGEAAKVDLHSVLTRYQIRVSDETELYHTGADSAEHLEEYEQILSYLSSAGKKHRNYRHYATRDRIKSILENKAIYLTDGSTWNDKFDRERFNPRYSSCKRFGTCLSSSTEESVAMWMLYGGAGGNGAMINFDRDTLLRAMSVDSYELGEFDSDGSFQSRLTLGNPEIDLSLSEVLYFKGNGDDITVMRSMGKDQQVRMSLKALRGIDAITKHASWSYEQEVRLVARVDTPLLGGHASHITCVKVPLEFTDDFVAKRVYDSPVSDGKGTYLDSKLCQTVDWDLCRGCTLKSGVGASKS